METDGRIGVLHVVSGLGLGGAEKMLLWSARYHDRSLIRMGVISLMSGGELAEGIRGEGVRVYELEQERGRLTPTALRRFMGTVGDFAPDILQGHMFHSNLLVRMAGVLRQRTVVLSTRHIDVMPLVRRVANSTTGFLNDGTLVFSPRVLEEERKENLFRRPIRMIPYGIEIPAEVIADPGSGGGIREELGIPANAFLWTAVGRLTAQKGFRHLLDAFSRVRNTGSGPFLLILGDGEERAALENLGKKLGLGPRLILPGFVKDVGPFLDASDAFVLSSLWEGGPLVVLEAMAAGLPVVSTRVGDTVSMVQEGRTGVLVDPGDPGQLAEAMNRILDMGPDAREWGSRGRARMEELYDFARVQRDMETWYRELAGAGASAA